MKKGKMTGRLIPMALSAILLFPSVSVSAAASDIKGHWAESVITQWQNKGLISGYADGTIHPDASIKRAEAATLVNQAMGYSGKANISFTDVGVGKWYYNAVATAVWAGYMNGYPDGTFRPDATVNRAEAALMIANVAGLGQNETTASYFTDYSAIPKWARGSVGAVVDAGLMSGYPDGSFGAKKAISRAEVISSIDRAITWKASAGQRAQQQAQQALNNSASTSTSSNTSTSSGTSSSSNSYGGSIYNSTTTASAALPSALMEYYNLLYPSTSSVSASVSSSASSSSSSSGKVESYVVREDGEKVKNKTITGDLIIDEDVDDGTVYIDNTTIEGDLVIEGGGEDSIYLDDVTVDGKVIMKKKNVHLEVSGDTRIKLIELRENCKITEDGLSKKRSIGKIKITKDLKSGKSTTIDVPTDKIIVDGKCKLILKSDVEKIEINDDGEDSTIEIKSGATVETVTANAAVRLEGGGSIETLEVKEDGVDLDSDLDIDDIDVDKGVDKPNYGDDDKTELTGYKELTAVTISDDQHLSDADKAADYLLEKYGKVTLKYGKNKTVEADITAWDCKDYDAAKAGKYTFTATYDMPKGYQDKEDKFKVTVTLELKVAQTAEGTKTELTGYEALTAVTVDKDEHLTDAAKAAKYLLDNCKKVTLKYGENKTVEADITAWTFSGKDYTTTADSKHTFTATYTMPDGYEDKVEPFTVTVELELKVAQTAESTTPGGGNTGTEPGGNTPENPTQKTELTGYEALATVTVSDDQHLTDAAKAADYLLEKYGKVTLKDSEGKVTAEATISAWTCDSYDTKKGEYTFKATYALSAADQAKYEAKANVTVTLKLDVAQTELDETAPKVEKVEVNATSGTVEVDKADPTKLTCKEGTEVESITVTMNEEVFLKDNASNEIAMKLTGNSSNPSIGKTYGTFTIGADKKTITITPSENNGKAAYLGTVTFTVEEGVLTDAAGNSAKYEFTLEVTDGTPPKMTGIKATTTQNGTLEPADMENKTIGCLQGTTVNGIQVTMDEPVQFVDGKSADTDNKIKMSMEGQSIGEYYGTFAIDAGGKTITITPYDGNKTAAYLGTVTFTVEEGVLEDKAGNTTEYKFYLEVSPVKSKISEIEVKTRKEALTEMFIAGQAETENDGNFTIVTASDLEQHNKFKIAVTATKEIKQVTSSEPNQPAGKYMGMAFVLTLPSDENSTKDITNVLYGKTSNDMSNLKKENVIKEETENKYKDKTFMFYLNANEFTEGVTEVKRYIKLEGDISPIELIFTFTDFVEGTTE